MVCMVMMVFGLCILHFCSLYGIISIIAKQIVAMNHKGKISA